MRLVGALAILVLAASSSYADRPPFEVVRVLQDTDQVLVFDRITHKHVLLEAGSTLDDYAVVEISGGGMIVEKQQERTAMYPLAMAEIAVSLGSPDHGNAPTIFGTVPLATTPITVAMSEAPHASYWDRVGRYAWAQMWTDKQPD